MDMPANPPPTIVKDDVVVERDRPRGPDGVDRASTTTSSLLDRIHAMVVMIKRRIRSRTIVVVVVVELWSFMDT